jgi:hypothetical protein
LPGYVNGYSFTLRTCHIIFNWLGSDKYEFVFNTGNDYSEREGITSRPIFWIRLNRAEVLDIVEAMALGLTEAHKKRKKKFKAKALEFAGCYLWQDKEIDYFGDHTRGYLDIELNSGALRKVRVDLCGRPETERLMAALKGFVTSKVVAR